MAKQVFEYKLHYHPRGAGRDASLLKHGPSGVITVTATTASIASRKGRS